MEVKEKFIGIRASEYTDAAELGPKMRKADRAEIAALGHSNPVRALDMCRAASFLDWTALVDDEIACMFGVSPVSLASGVGSPWLLGSSIMDKHPLAFVKMAPHFIGLMLDVFPRLENVVDARNRKAVRWLRYAGFTIHPAEPYGPEGIAFHPFDMERSS